MPKQVGYSPSATPGERRGRRGRRPMPGAQTAAWTAGGPLDAGMAAAGRHD